MFELVNGGSLNPLFTGFYAFQVVQDFFHWTVWKSPHMPSGNSDSKFLKSLATRRISLQFTVWPCEWRDHNSSRCCGTFKWEIESDLFDLIVKQYRFKYFNASQGVEWHQGQERWWRGCLNCVFVGQLKLQHISAEAGLIFIDRNSKLKFKVHLSHFDLQWTMW